jgi:hypothetical protein
MESEIMEYLLSSGQLIQKSIDLHLHFLRAMKEHAFFLEAGFTGRDADLAQEAENFKNVFTNFLWETVALANGTANEAVLTSGETFTNFTLATESATEFYTNVNLNSEITAAEFNIAPYSGQVLSAELQNAVIN